MRKDENGKAIGEHMPKITPPTLEQMKAYTRRDLSTARYFLAMILDRYPEIVDKIAEEIYHSAMTKENGAAIDHVAPKEYAIGQ